MLYTYANNWHINNDWAQVVLPEGDFDITYTATIYTQQLSAYLSPALALAEADAVGVTVDNVTGKLVYVRGDNFTGACKNLDESEVDAAGNPLGGYQAIKINYTTQSTSSCFAGTMTSPLYTKTEGLLTTNLCDLTGINISVRIVRSGDNFTVTYTNTDTQAVLYAFSFTASMEGSLVLGIGGEATYFENIQISGAENLVLSKTTSGTKTQVDTTGFTQVTA